jgi:hypothetical protein
VTGHTNEGGFRKRPMPATKNMGRKIQERLNLGTDQNAGGTADTGRLGRSSGDALPTRARGTVTADRPAAFHGCGDLFGRRNATDRGWAEAEKTEPPSSVSQSAART